MGKARRVNEGIWRSGKFQELDPGGKLLLFYLLTSRQVNDIGIYELELNEAGAILNISGDDCQLLLEELADNLSSVFQFDPVTRVVWFHRWWESYWRVPATPGEVRAWLHSVNTLPDSKLISGWYEITKDMLEGRGDAFVKAFAHATGSLVRGGGKGGDLDLLRSRRSKLCFNIKKEDKTPTTGVVGGGPGGGEPGAGNPVLTSPTGFQEKITGPHPLEGKARFTGNSPLWFDWQEYAWRWLSPQVKMETEVKWIARFPNVNSAMLLGKVAEWLEQNPARGRRRKSLVKWLGMRWFAIDQEKLAANGRAIRSTRLTPNGKQVTNDEDDWNGIAKA